jgi:hypothetical protein
MMWWKRIATVSLVAGMFVSVGASGVGATEDDPIFEDGRYVLKIPGVGEMTFEVYADPIEGEKTVTTRVAPVGYDYRVDDDDPDKEAWKDAAAGLEVEMKLDKIESDITWDGDDPGIATLRLSGGSLITVTEPNADGDFTVMASGDLWTAVGSGSDWMVVYRENIEDEDPTRFLKVEATEDGIEIKAVSGDGYPNYLKEEYEEEEEEEAEEAESDDDDSEDDDSEGAGHGKEKNQGKGKNN